VFMSRQKDVLVARKGKVVFMSRQQGALVPRKGKGLSSCLENRMC
jgi:hypothetical protein